MRGLSPARALIVDDNPVVLKVVCQMLEALGYLVDSAEGGVEAFRILFQFRYDLVLTDLQLPEKGGFNLARWIKRKSQETKVIIMTSCCHAEVVDSMNAGIVNSWIFKPFGLSKLAAVLGHCYNGTLQNKHRLLLCLRRKEWS